MALSFVALSLQSCATAPKGYGTFADYPGFAEVYKDDCQSELLSTQQDLSLLKKFRPRLFIAPNSNPPIDFYKDYIAHADLYHFSARTQIVRGITKAKLNQIHRVPGYYLVHRAEKMQQVTPTAYGRVYVENVRFMDAVGKVQEMKLKFLKYSFTFAASGLPEKLPYGANTFLSIFGLSPDDWHQLDHYTAVTMVLNDADQAIAVLLAQHNHHRSYLVGKHVVLGPNGQISLDVAKRSNELYLSSNDNEVKSHRVIRWGLYRKYLISGKDAPFFKAWDRTYGPNAGGQELNYDLSVLSPCDPFYQAKIFLGEPRPLLGFYIGRDGPPGADYYTLPKLLPLSKLLKFSYFHEGQKDDITALDRFIDVDNKKMDVDALVSHGEKKFIQDLQKLHSQTLSRQP